MGSFQLSVGSRGIYTGSKWVHFGGVLSLTITPIRARAYNDSAKDAVLLKTASKHVQAGVRGTPI